MNHHLNRPIGHPLPLQFPYRIASTRERGERLFPGAGTIVTSIYADMDFSTVQGIQRREQQGGDEWKCGFHQCNIVMSRQGRWAPSILRLASAKAWPINANVFAQPR